MEEWTLEDLVKNEQQMDRLEKIISTYPQGVLFVRRHNEKYRWYLKENGKTYYLSLKEIDLAKKMAMKRYLECQLEDLKDQRKKIKFYLEQNNLRDEAGLTHTDRLRLNPGFQELLNIPKKDYHDWQYEDYPHLEDFSEDLKLALPDGRKVRSKSEVIIGTALLTKGIPFRYDVEIKANGNIYYVDFVAINLHTKVHWYWEHFGSMDKPDYQKKQANKTRDYMLSGLFQGINLIITSETSKNPWDYQKTDRIIEAYLLS
ncbi:MAG: hypothetical protein J6P72_09415 [Firmicutes bacterium]|nr:hypothetical protein [Bacillota bacterium]